MRHEVMNLFGSTLCTTVQWLHPNYLGFSFFPLIKKTRKAIIVPFMNHELLAEMLGVAREKKIEKQILKKRKFDFFF